MTFARRVFLLAGTYGLIVLVPQYFLETKNGIDFPPPITHPEYYYGFVGVAVAWQFVFLLLSRDPVRYRLLMVPAMLEKAAFGIPAIVLYATHRTSAVTLGFGLFDLFLGTLFAISFAKTSEPASNTGAST